MTKNLLILILKTKMANHGISKLPNYSFSLELLDLGGILEKIESINSLDSIGEICSWMQKKMGFNIAYYFQNEISRENFGRSVQLLAEYSSKFKHIIESNLLTGFDNNYLFSGKLIEEIKEGIRFQRYPIGDAHFLPGPGL
ncbi:MAG: hypothetical protein IPJ40_03910 [Saprospirales bacterium]|nr:hypothetical protein [Saprospirales bacterium]